MTSANWLICFLLCFIGGIFIASFFKAPTIIFYEIIGLGLFYCLLSLFLKPKKLKITVFLFGFCFFLLALGLWRAHGQSIASPYSSAAQYSEDRSRTIVGKGLEKLKNRFGQVIAQNLSPPKSSALGAVLLGKKAEISQEFKEKLNRAGLRHITAISGMHIVILSQILFWLALALGFWRGQAFYLAIAVLWLFILMIGFPASAVRAGVMGSIFLLAEKLGRQKTADRALLLTGAVMLAINPSLLRWSIGFQLSFAATLGIIYLMPFLQSFFQKITKLMFRFTKSKHWKGAGSDPALLASGALSKTISLIAMSLAAQVFVLPLLIFYFGQFSIVSPLTNLLVVPLLPYLMGLGLAFVILGALWPPLAFIMLFPVWLLLSYITKITELFAGLSWSALNFSLHWVWLIIIYLLLIITIWQIKKRQEMDFLP